MTATVATGTNFDVTRANDLETIGSKMKDAVEGADDAVGKALDNINNTKDGGKINAAQLANVQMAMNKWSISYSLTASTNRTIKDMMSGIIQKI